jgi:hypothetical protein
MSRDLNASNDSYQRYQNNDYLNISIDLDDRVTDFSITIICPICGQRPWDSVKAILRHIAYSHGMPMAKGFMGFSSDDYHTPDSNFWLDSLTRFRTFTESQWDSFYVDYRGRKKVHRNEQMLIINRRCLAKKRSNYQRDPPPSCRPQDLLTKRRNPFDDGDDDDDHQPKRMKGITI